MNSNTLKYCFAWILLPFIATFNAILRELTYSQLLGEQKANQVASVILALIIVFYVLALNAKIELQKNSQAIMVGVVWFFLTILFEFALGFALGTPFSEQLANYDILKGNLWVLVLLSVLLSPILLRGHKIFIGAVK